MPYPIPNSASEDSALVHDEEFYMDTVIFQVGRTLFKVPMYALPTEDGIFASMFELPNGHGEGSSEENPICLPTGITPEDFRCFLKARIPMPDTTGPPQLSITQWMSVIKLATMWCLDNLRTRAIESVDKDFLARAGCEMVDVYKICLGKEYRVSRWLLEGYEALGKRDAYLSPAERQELGAETSLRISELRELSWAFARAHGLHRSRYDYRSEITTLFEDELRLDPGYVAPSQTPSRLIAPTPNMLRLRGPNPRW